MANKPAPLVTAAMHIDTRPQVNMTNGIHRFGPSFLSYFSKKKKIMNKGLLVKVTPVYASPQSFNPSNGILTARLAGISPNCFLKELAALNTQSGSNGQMADV